MVMNKANSLLCSSSVAQDWSLLDASINTAVPKTSSKQLGLNPSKQKKDLVKIHIKHYNAHSNPRYVSEFVVLGIVIPLNRIAVEISRDASPRIKDRKTGGEGR